MMSHQLKISSLASTLAVVTLVLFARAGAYGDAPYAASAPLISVQVASDIAG